MLPQVNPSTLARVCGALNEAEVRYLVVGGVAVVAHGVLRQTVDLDLVVQLSERNAADAVRVLSASAIARAPPSRSRSSPMPKRANGGVARRCHCLHARLPLRSMTALDLFLAEPFDFEAAYTQRALLPVGAVDVPVVGLATLIAMKQAAGRHRDLADIEDLQRVARDGGAVARPPRD